MNEAFDELFKSKGVYFLPWIGDRFELGFCGRKFLVLGESHYATWDNEHHHLPPTFTRECIREVVSREDGARFWKNLEQALLNEYRQNRWCLSGGAGLWSQFAFYQFVQFPISGGPRVRPSPKQFNDSIPAFAAVLETLRPERVLVCGKTLWGNMDSTQLQLNAYIEAYQLANGYPAWCLAIDHPSSGRFSWGRSHRLIKAFLNDPRDAATLLSCEK